MTSQQKLAESMIVLNRLLGDLFVSMSSTVTDEQRKVIDQIDVTFDNLVEALEEINKTGEQNEK